MKLKKSFISSILAMIILLISYSNVSAEMSNSKSNQVLIKNNIEEFNNLQNGWFEENENWYFYKNSIKQTGWLELNGIWYYLKPSGAMATGWEKINNVYYYFNQSGSMKTGWLELNGIWYYLKPSGAMATGWLDISGKWYYFYESGIMASNTVIDGWTIGSNGVGIPPSISNGNSSTISTVYITPGGKSYHKSRNCTALKRSSTILSVSLNNALSQGKSDPCNLCVR